MQHARMLPELNRFCVALLSYYSICGCTITIVNCADTGVEKGSRQARDSLDSDMKCAVTTGEVKKDDPCQKMC